MKKIMTALLVVVALLVPTPVWADGLPCDQYDPQCANALPRTGFYTTPLRPWELVRAEPFTGYALDPGVSATRILYRSNGESVSGVVLLPAGRRPPSGWPVIAYGHGASGYASRCAPSLMADLYHGTQLTTLLRNGYAIVASDYAGLGGPGKHELGSKETQAANIIDALHAAHLAVPGLSRKWVAYGHSQGGLAVLGVAEHVRFDPGYLGTVATSPVSHFAELLDAAAHNPYAAGFVPLAVTGAQVAYPALQPSDILTDEAVHRLPIIETSCLNTTVGAYADLTGPNLVKPGYLNNPYLARYIQESEPTPSKARGPILLLQGKADTLVLPQFSAKLAASLGTKADYREYPGLTHDTFPGGPTGIDDGAMPDIIQWLNTRFA
jgi:alpha-beta hydrolase superfamily lysophospholipase